MKRSYRGSRVVRVVRAFRPASRDRNKTASAAEVVDLSG
jgi:hypothetical protein